MIINKIIVDKVIELGKSLDRGEAINIDSFNLKTQNIRMIKNYFEEMDTDLLIYLIKGMTILEENGKGWGGASVTSISHLFNCLIKKKPGSEILDEVSQWVISNTTNPYAPYGSYRRNSKKYTEYVIEKLKEENEKIAKMKEREEQILKNKIRRETEKKERIIKHETQKSEREVTLHHLSNLSLRDRLLYIANSKNHPLYFPEEYIQDITDNILREIDRVILKNLSEKIVGKVSAPWEELKLKIIEIID